MTCPPLPSWADWSNRADTLGLRVRSGELAGPCPSCGGDDRFHVRRRGADALVGCRGCIDGGGFGFGAVVRAVFPERFKARDRARSPENRSEASRWSRTAGYPAATPKSRPGGAERASAGNPAPGMAESRGNAKTALVRRLWARSVPADDQLARVYLARRFAWSPRGIGPDLPATVRWLAREAAPGSDRAATRNHAATPERQATHVLPADRPRRAETRRVLPSRRIHRQTPARSPSADAKPAHPCRYRDDRTAHLRRQTRQHPRPPRFHLRTVQQTASVAVLRPPNMPHARTRERAGEAGPENPASGAVSRDAREQARVGVAREGCGEEGCERPALRHDKRFERPLCRRHLCQAIEAWRDANRAASRCWRCGADKGDSPYRDCDGCRRVNAESCRRYRARRARLRDKHKARDEWRATAAADERARWLRRARLRWLGKVSALFLRRGRPQSVTLPDHLVVEKIQLDIEAAQLGIRGWD